MDLIWVIALAILGVVGAAISRQMTDEFKAWLPWILRYIIDRAVRLLPDRRRERFSEEWRSHVNDVPGDTGKLVVALGFLFASAKIAGVPAAAARRVFDLVFSGLLITFLLPVTVLISFMIKVESAGPVFFRQERIGKKGERFSLFKFRTMSVTESRTTKFGTFLHRSGIDELPQLINVLRGDMSLVGPRPRAPDQHAAVSRDGQFKPGLFHEAPADLAEDAEQGARERSLWLDIKIVGRHLARIFGDRADRS